MSYFLFTIFLYSLRYLDQFDFEGFIAIRKFAIKFTTVKVIALTFKGSF